MYIVLVLLLVQSLIVFHVFCGSCEHLLYNDHMLCDKYTVGDILRSGDSIFTQATQFPSPPLTVPPTAGSHHSRYTIEVDTRNINSLLTCISAQCWFAAKLIMLFLCLLSYSDYVIKGTCVHVLGYM